MNLREVENYSIGLDIGTGSVGWAVIDENGDLCRFKGKPTWGSRLFKSAETAQKRRTFRGQRRRYDRRRQRLNLLQQFFAEEIAKVDPEFFIRLNQATLHKEDRDPNHETSYQYPLFPKSHPLVLDGEEITEREYYKKFPTIYHLRDYLVHHEGETDIRLVYLALHNIVKHRGNFLLEDMPELKAADISFDKAVGTLCETLSTWCEMLSAFSDEDAWNELIWDEEERSHKAQALTKILAKTCCENAITVVDDDQQENENTKENEPKVTKADKKDEIIKTLGLSSKTKNLRTAIANAVLGYQANFSAIFYPDAEEKDSFPLSDENKVEEYECPDEGVALFDALQKVHMVYTLLDILGGKPEKDKTISSYKVDDYTQYESQLNSLKQFVRDRRGSDSETEGYKRVQALYNEFFRGNLYKNGNGKHKYDPFTAKGYTKYDAVHKATGTGKNKQQSYDLFAKELVDLFDKLGNTDDEVSKIKQNTKAEKDRDEKIEALRKEKWDKDLWSKFNEVNRALEERRFLRHLKTSDNGVIPYQLHLEEMSAIIEKQDQYYPFLREEKDKLESLVAFRIPYYVGPLTKKFNKDEPAPFAWISRNPGTENESIRPWNWEEIVDKEKTAQDFIQRMTGKCTYFRDQDVLPRHSLLYEEYCVLNEINAAKYIDRDGKLRNFSKDLRQKMIEELFKHQKSVTYKKVGEWLQKELGSSHPYTVKGGQKDDRFESSLCAYQDFKKILNLDDLSDCTEMVEDLIREITLFEDRPILKARLQQVTQRYKYNLSDEQINKLCNKRTQYKGWGRLSREFLTKTLINSNQGPLAIIDVLRDGYPNNATPEKGSWHPGDAMNLQKIITNLGVQKKIDDHNNKYMQERDELSRNERVKELIGSPALARGITQALKVVDEIKRITKKPPTHIYVEVTREESAANKGKTTSKRKDKLKKALGELRKEFEESGISLSELSKKDVNTCLSELDKKDTDFKNDREDKRMLYFSQCGKCLYSGKPLDLTNMHLYQIDHVLCQGLTTDNSLDNRVLVHGKINQYKGDNLLLDPKIIKEHRAFWEQLKKCDLISEKKFNNLTRTSISDAALNGFINRQLVQTSQMVKHAQTLLKQEYLESGVHPVKAGVSSQLRKKFNLPKSRIANDYHHAHDAYLACQIGRFISTYFPEIYSDLESDQIKMREKGRSWFRKLSKSSKHEQKNKEMPGSAGFLVSNFSSPQKTKGADPKTGEKIELVWDPKKEQERIEHCFDMPQCFISHMPYEDSGEFWKQQAVSPKNPSKKNLNLPLKKGLNPKKYGGYSSKEDAYYFVYEAIEPKTRKKKLEFAGVPRCMAAALASNPLALETYAKDLAQTKGLEFRCIRRSKIRKHQSITLGNSRLKIHGSKEVRNDRQFTFSRSETDLLQKLEQDEDYSAKVPDKEEFDEQLLSLWLSIKDKYAAFAPLLSKQLNLKNFDDGFQKATPKDRGKVLVDLALFATGGGPNTVDLSKIGGNEQAGKKQITFSKELAKGNLCFIDTSVTGMFEYKTKIAIQNETQHKGKGV